MKSKLFSLLAIIPLISSCSTANAEVENQFISDVDSNGEYAVSLFKPWIGEVQGKRKLRFDISIATNQLSNLRTYSITISDFTVSCDFSQLTRYNWPTVTLGSNTALKTTYNFNIVDSATSNFDDAKKECVVTFKGKTNTVFLEKGVVTYE